MTVEQKGWTQSLKKPGIAVESKKKKKEKKGFDFQKNKAKEIA